MRPRNILIVAGLLFLGACAGSAQVRSVAALAIACDTFQTAVGQTIPLIEAGKLSDGDIDKIQSARRVADKACAEDSTVDPAEYVGIVENLTAQVGGIVKGE